MQDQDRQAIESLFTRLGEVGRQAPSRDGEAEAYIAEQMRRQPGSAYFMAQTIVAQEAALTEAQRRIEALETRGAAQEGGFLSRLFGGGAPAPQARPAARPQPIPQAPQQQGAWGPAPRQGGGFLAGAAQTAVGVAGGMMMANMLTGMLSGGEEQLAGVAEEAGMDEHLASQEDLMADAGGFDDFEDI